jgi:hypothetical protein
MASRVAHRVANQPRELRAPRTRVISPHPEKGQFFPGEVARMLKIESLDYRQLRSIYQLVREQAGHTYQPKEWARFSYDDIAAALEVVRICIESRGLDTKVRFTLVLLHLRKACLKLQGSGFTNPLLQLRLQLVEGRVIAEIDGATLDAETGQQLIDLAALRVTDFFATTDIDAKLLEMLASVKAVQEASSRPSRLILTPM